MTYKIFIDGAEGTTGLKLHQYFSKRDDIELLHIAVDKRKNIEERLAFVRKADVSFLCLPDDAAKELAQAAPKDCRILDTSTAHRTADGWIYGMPELDKERRQKIRNSNRVSVPGCHATGAILLIRPLIEAGIIAKDYPFAMFSLTGYSGGGKKMIAQYEAPGRFNGGGEATAETFTEDIFKSPRQYATAQAHKHLPEIIEMTGISSTPAFIPVVADYYRGMQVTIPIKGSSITTAGGKGASEIVNKALHEFYCDRPLVKVVESMDDNGFIAANRLAGTNRLEIAVEGNDENILLIATYDNLGKGASGAAIQNMNIMLGIDEEKGLI